jgi:hypothetical protein
VSTKPGQAQSAKFKHAVAIRRYFTETREETPPEHQEAVLFADTAGTKIEALRQKNGWVERPKGKPEKAIHPDRWTKNKLDQDCVAADRHDLGRVFSFHRFYETRYRSLCWDVHGSAFVGRKIGEDIFPFVAARCFEECADLAEILSWKTIKSLGLWNPDVEATFAVMTTRRKEAKVLAYAVTKHAVQPGVDDGRSAPAG